MSLESWVGTGILDEMRHGRLRREEYPVQEKNHFPSFRRPSDVSWVAEGSS